MHTEEVCECGHTRFHHREMTGACRGPIGRESGISTTCWCPRFIGEPAPGWKVPWRWRAAEFGLNIAAPFLPTGTFASLFTKLVDRQEDAAVDPELSPKPLLDYAPIWWLPPIVRWVLLLPLALVLGFVSFMAYGLGEGWRSAVETTTGVLGYASKGRRSDR